MPLPFIIGAIGWVAASAVVGGAVGLAVGYAIDWIINILFLTVDIIKDAIRDLARKIVKKFVGSKIKKILKRNGKEEYLVDVGLTEADGSETNVRFKTEDYDRPEIYKGRQILYYA